MQSWTWTWKCILNLNFCPSPKVAGPPPPKSQVRKPQGNRRWVSRFRCTAAQESWGAIGPAPWDATPPPTSAPRKGRIPIEGRRHIFFLQKLAFPGYGKPAGRSDPTHPNGFAQPPNLHRGCPPPLGRGGLGDQLHFGVSIVGWINLGWKSPSARPRALFQVLELSFLQQTYKAGDRFPEEDRLRNAEGGRGNFLRGSFSLTPRGSN